MNIYRRTKAVETSEGCSIFNSLILVTHFIYLDNVDSTIEYPSPVSTDSAASPSQEWNLFYKYLYSDSGPGCMFANKYMFQWPSYEPDLKLDIKEYS